MDRTGVRLALRQAQADAGDIALLHADESEALTTPMCSRLQSSALVLANSADSCSD